MTRVRRLGRDDVRVAAQPQLPPLLHGPDHLGQRHVDAAARAGVADPRADEQQRRRARHRGRVAVPADVAVRRVGRRDRRPLRQAPAALSPRRSRPGCSHSALGLIVAPAPPTVLDRVRLLGAARLRQRLRQPGAPDVRHGDGRPRGAAERGRPQQRRDEQLPRRRPRGRRHRHRRASASRRASSSTPRRTSR